MCGVLNFADSEASSQGFDHGLQKGENMRSKNR